MACSWFSSVQKSVLSSRSLNKTSCRLSAFGVLLSVTVQRDLNQRHAEQVSYRVSQLVNLLGGQISRDTVIRQADRMVSLGQAQLLVRGEKGRGLESEYVFTLNPETSFAQVAKDQQVRKHHARKRSCSKNPQNARLLPPSESSSSKKPPAEATPRPQAANSKSPVVAVGSEDLLKKEAHQALTEAIASSDPSFCPSKARKVIQAAALKPKDLELLSREIGAVLAEIRKEARNPIGLLLFRLSHEPGRIMACARNASNRRESVAHACSALPPVARMLSLEATTAFTAWKQAEQSLPPADAPDFLDASDLEAMARKHLVSVLENEIPSEVLNARREALVQDLEGKGLSKGSFVWNRAWDHRWYQGIFEMTGLIAKS